MSGSGRWSRRAGIVGVVGLTLTVAAGVVRSNPGLARRLAAIADWLVEVVFQVSAVLAFLVGFAVVVYSYLKQRRGETTERVRRRTAVGVISVFVLSFGLVLVVLEDLAAVLGRALATVGPDLPGRLYFYAGLATFGTLTLVGVAGAVRRRVGT